MSRRRAWLLGQTTRAIGSPVDKRRQRVKHGGNGVKLEATVRRRLHLASANKAAWMTVFPS